MSPGVYLHLPFCTSRCRYCGFYSGESPSRRGELAGRLGAEMDLRRAELLGPVGSVYLGGGTPSLLAPEQVGQLIGRVRRTWGLAPGAEITLEANPGDSLALKAFLEAGVTRLSVGVQSLDDETLHLLGRRHTADQARDLLVEARAAGFSRLSADLLLGLPETAPDELSRWVEELVGRGAEHLSLYSLELHPGTDLAAAAEEGLFRPADGALEEDQYRAVAEAAEGCGLEGYEVSNFAAAGQRCRHNRVYWQGGAYLGVGPGAHSFLPGAGSWGTRRWNDADLDAYLAGLERGRLPPGGSEELTREQALLERLFLELRCREPLDPGAFATRFGLNPGATAEAFRALADTGLLEAVSGGLLRPAWGALRRADGLALALHGRLLDNPAAP